MRKLVVTEFVSLDGVLQSPATADEDTEGGFTRGGWQPAYFDEVMLSAATEGMAETDAYLFGRKTYQKMAAYWPTAPSDDPFTDHLNSTVKYVASNTLERVDWQNSVLLGDVVDELTKIKDQPGKNIAVLGSGDLARTLINADLVDEYSLFVCPLLLGSGKRLFTGIEQVHKLTLAGTQTTGTGTVILTYRPTR